MRLTVEKKKLQIKKGNEKFLTLAHKIDIKFSINAIPTLSHRLDHILNLYRYTLEAFQLMYV